MRSSSRSVRDRAADRSRFSKSFTRPLRAARLPSSNVDGTPRRPDRRGLGMLPLCTTTCTTVALALLLPTTLALCALAGDRRPACAGVRLLWCALPMGERLLVSLSTRATCLVGQGVHACLLARQTSRALHRRARETLTCGATIEGLLVCVPCST